jgi:hypothetical protein
VLSQQFEQVDSGQRRSDHHCSSSHPDDLVDSVEVMRQRDPAVD